MERKKRMNSEIPIANLRIPKEEVAETTIFLADRLLPKEVFLECLRLEKKRASRTDHPLSIVLFYLEPEKPEKRQKGHRPFLEYLIENTRETDLKGWLDRNVIAVLLPDTDQDGLKHYERKILKGNGRSKITTVSATYPDHLFERLLAERETTPDLFPLELDEGEGRNKFGLAIKRGIDIAGSIGGLTLLFPLMVLIAVAVKVSSPGPVLFRQTRLGLKGTRFLFYKFRSMYWNSSDRVHRQYVASLIEGKIHPLHPQGNQGPLYKISRDNRVTRVGKILRKLSLDELPQLINVFKGEMSLVGPRPPIPYEIEKYKPWHLQRVLEMKPGMTGLWQVGGRSTTTFDEMVRLDLRYVRKWSLWLDFKILLKTVIAVFKTRNVA